MTAEVLDCVSTVTIAITSPSLSGRDMKIQRFTVFLLALLLLSTHLLNLSAKCQSCYYPSLCQEGVKPQKGVVKARKCERIRVWDGEHWLQCDFNGGLRGTYGHVQRLKEMNSLQGLTWYILTVVLWPAHKPGVTEKIRQKTPIFFLLILSWNK